MHINYSSNTVLEQVFVGFVIANCADWISKKLKKLLTDMGLTRRNVEHSCLFLFTFIKLTLMPICHHIDDIISPDDNLVKKHQRYDAFSINKVAKLFLI